MPMQLQKSLRDYLSKIKKPVITTPLFHMPPSKSVPFSTSWVRLANKRSKATPFATSNDPKNDHIRKDDAGDDDKDGKTATLCDMDRFLRENFKSLYKNDDFVGEEVKDKDGGVKKRNVEERTSSYFCDSPTLTTPPPSFMGKGPRFHVPHEFSGSLIDEHVDVRCSGNVTTNHHNINNSNKVVDGSKCRDIDDDDDEEEEEEEEKKEMVGINNFIAI